MATCTQESNARREIRVFIASPGDLAVERRAFKDAIDLLNLGFADGARVRFIPLGWEDVLASTGRRVQSVIDRDIDSCEIFVLAMHRRWGQDAPDTTPYTSYTEAEFHRALERYHRTGTPEIFVFFRNIDPGQTADPGPQLARVLQFRRQLEDSRQVLYRTFEGPEQFKNEVDRHLRAYAKGELPDRQDTPEAIILPLEYTEAVERAEAKARQLADQLTTSQLLLARQAAVAASVGRLEDARQCFAKAVEGTMSLTVLSLASEFYHRTGELAIAEEVVRRYLAISGEDSVTKDVAAALSSLGVIHGMRGDLDRAEEMHCKALAIHEKLDLQEGIADDYGNLAVICKARGDLEHAEEMHRNSLAINEKLGRQERMAINYGNLGIIYKTRGDLDRAEEMHCKALAINEKLGLQEGMADDYGNLGVIYLVVGDLDRSEEMHHKSLTINEKLGRQGRMATNFGNLGLLYRARGDLDLAENMLHKALVVSEKLGLQGEMASDCGYLGVIYKARGNLVRAAEMHRRSLAINEKLGLQEGMARDYGNLGVIYQTNGDLDRAEEMHRKSLAVNEKLGRQEGLAINYGNLGGIYTARHNLDLAEEMLRKAIAINEKLGRQEGMAHDYGNLGSIYNARGQTQDARRLWTLARDTYAQIGMPHKMVQLQEYLDRLPTM